MSLALDLGCGQNPKNFFSADEVYGIDLKENSTRNIHAADLAIEDIPFKDQMFDYVTAHDFIEHVPRVIYFHDRNGGGYSRRQPFVELMNNIHRVLKPGGQFLSFTPAYPNAAAFWDPTHVNFITEETFPLYFCEGKLWASAYGFSGSFALLSQQWHGPHLVTILSRSVSPTS